MKDITFITGNSSKAEQLSRHLGYPIKHLKLDIPEIQSLDLQEVTKYKAEQAYKQTNSPVLVEDTSLTFNALGKLPGPLIKWFLIELDNEGLCKILDSYEDRSALAKVCFGLYDGKDFRVFEGEIKGTISVKPRGDRGFGWDPVFIPEGKKKTWGEMEMDEQNETSMRKLP
ncbi:MAG: non-canonical purine NTP pyrophosphatase [Candidatus Nomurabacteria bacterium]|nr:non-canonical purine NTP pyrophosphatase [Candidatus Nomurabacteria bacterium]